MLWTAVLRFDFCSIALYGMRLLCCVFIIAVGSRCLFKFSQKRLFSRQRGVRRRSTYSVNPILHTLNAVLGIENVRNRLHPNCLQPLSFIGSPLSTRCIAILVSLDLRQCPVQIHEGRQCVPELYLSVQMLLVSLQKCMVVAYSARVRYGFCGCRCGLYSGVRCSLGILDIP